MSADTIKLLNDALTLPAEARAALAAKLIERPGCGLLILERALSAMSADTIKLLMVTLADLRASLDPRGAETS